MASFGCCIIHFQQTFIEYLLNVSLCAIEINERIPYSQGALTWWKDSTGFSPLLIEAYAKSQRDLKLPLGRSANGK